MVTLDTIAKGVIGTAQDYDITFSEAVTGLAVIDFSVSTNIEASGDLVVNSVTPASGPSTTYTISITPRATAFTLTLAIDSVTDTATIPNMGPATAASAIGRATAPLALTAPPAQFHTKDTTIVGLTLPAATGGTAPYTYSVSGHPAGLNFAGGSRRLAGTPTAVADNTVTYRVTDSATPSATVSTTFFVGVTASLALNGAPDQFYTVGTAINLVLPPATGASGELTYTLTGQGDALPAGLTFDAANRALFGTPTEATSATELTYKVSDAGSDPAKVFTRLFNVTVAAAPLALTKPPDQFHTKDTTIVDLVLPAATIGTTPYTYTLNDLPAGLNFDAGTRTLSGTPTTVSFALAAYTVTDANGFTVSKTFLIRVVAGLALNLPPAQFYTVGTAINLVLPAATGASGELTYTLTGPGDGALPAGLTFDAASRTLSGTPSEVTSATSLAYRVSDDGNDPANEIGRAFNVTVAAAATTAPTSDTSLATLTLTGSHGNEITLTPAFMAGVSVDSPYTASVANGVTSVTIAASSTHATTNIVVVVNGAQVTGDKSPSPVTVTGNLTEVGSTPNTIEIEVTAEDGNSFESYNIHITRAGPPPGIALRRDTAADGGVNTDRLTRNRDIDVTLATGFNTNSDTWEYSTDGGVTAFVPGTGTSFTLPAVSADYAADQVRVRQTVDGIRSDFAGLDAFTIDADAPTANLGSITGAVIDRAGQTHDITFSEAVAGLAAGDFSASTGITVTAVSGSDGGTAYTITYTATAASFNLILTAGSVTDLAAWPVAETSQAGTATAPLPVITGPATLSIPENTSHDTLLGSYTTTADVDRLTVFTSVLEGGLFRLGSNGELRFDNEPSFSPDYEAPRDQGADNVYNITIRGVDGSLQPVTQGLEVTITVTNVDEPGAISAITGDAQVGVTLTAGTVTDLDSPPAGTPVSSITHQWQSAVDGTDAAAAVDDAAWPDISGATGAIYDPGVGDVGRIIRVVATYTDGEGGGKKVASAATGAVAPAPSTDSTLSALDVSAGTLNPTFDAATNAYAVSVGTDVASVTVTPTTTDDGAAVAVNDVPVASGQPSEAIDLDVGNNTIPIVVTAEDTSTQTYTVTVARAVPQPGIALASDTARDGGTNTDRITRNRSIVVTLHADFQNDRDTWEWSSNSGNSHTTGSNTDRSFDLTASQATYNDNVVRARQTVNGVVSEFAGLARFMHDTVKPTISLNGGGASVTITKGDAYNDPVTADDVLDGPIAFSNIVITDGPVDVDTAGEYTLTYNVMDSAGNAADPLTRTVTVSEPVAEPTVTVERLPDNSIEVSWDNIPGVDFTIYAIKTGENNVIIIELVTSPHTIATTDPLFDTANDADAIGVRGFAEGNPVGDHSAQITSDEVPADTTPPTVTLGPIAEGVIDTAQDYDITFSEPVTGLAVDDFSVSNSIVASGDLVVNSVTPASGPSTTYTISITPRATAFTLTLAANSVTDTATTPNMGPAAEASATGTATVTAAPPGAPTGLTARPGDATVTLAWTAPGATGGADITGYEYRQSDATGDYDTTGSAAVVDWMAATGDYDTTGSAAVVDWMAIPNSATATEYTVAGLTNDTAYFFEVRHRHHP